MRRKKVSSLEIHSSSFRRIGLSALHVDFCQHFQKLIMTQLDSIKSSASVIFGPFVGRQQKKKSHEKAEEHKCPNTTRTFYFMTSAHFQYLISGIKNLAKSWAHKCARRNIALVIFQFLYFLINVIALNSNDNELRTSLG